MEAVGSALTRESGGRRKWRILVGEPGVHTLSPVGAKRKRSVAVIDCGSAR